MWFIIPSSTKQSLHPNIRFTGYGKDGVFGSTNFIGLKIRNMVLAFISCFSLATVRTFERFERYNAENYWLPRWARGSSKLKFANHTSLGTEKLLRAAKTYSMSNSLVFFIHFLPIFCPFSAIFHQPCSLEINTP